jgi:hypothetical protein
MRLISWNLAGRVSEAFAPCGLRPEAFYPCYGLAETTLFGGIRANHADFPPCRIDVHDSTSHCPTSVRDVGEGGGAGYRFLNCSGKYCASLRTFGVDTLRMYGSTGFRSA